MQLNQKVDSMVKLSENISSVQTEILQLLAKGTVLDHPEVPRGAPDAMSLLSLPGSLRKTMLALYKLEKATAEELSVETNRQRAVESSCANQLTRLGYVKKKRVGRKVVFCAENGYTES